MFAVNTDTYPAGKYVQMINKDLVYFSIYSQHTFRRKRKKAADIEEAKRKKGGGWHCVKKNSWVKVWVAKTITGPSLTMETELELGECRALLEKS